MPVKAGQIVINLTLGQAQFMQDLVKAKAGVKDFGAEGTRAFRELGTHGVSSVQATSGALRTLEGHFGNNIRAVERFLVMIPGLGRALQVAFPLIGGIAFGGLLVDLGAKAFKFFKDIQEAPDKISNAFRQINQPIRLANDELALANARLEQDIAKLEGRHENTLATALAEAKVQADKLADALDNDLEKINKLLKENAIGGLTAFFTGQGSTSQDQDEISRFQKQLAEIDARGNASVHSAANADAAKNAQAKWDKEIDDALAIEIAAFKAAVERTQHTQDMHAGKFDAPTYAAYWLDQETAKKEGRAPKYLGYNSSARTPDVSGQLAEEKGTLSNLEYLRDQTGLGSKNTALQQRKGELEADKTEDEQAHPFENRMNALAAQITAAKAKLEAIGKPEAAQILAKAFGAAQIAITETNKELERHGAILTDTGERQLLNAETTKATVEAETQWKEKLAASTSSISERIAATNALTAAIGKGYEATKQASVESQLMQELGQHYGDAAFMAEHLADVEKLRGQYSAEFDAKHAQQSAEAVEHLREQIALESALAAAQKNGAEAVRQATLAATLERLKLAGATREQIQAEMDLYNAQRENATAADISKIEQQIATTQRLTDAIGKGAAAMRAAALANKLAEAEREDGSHPGTILGPRGVAAVQEDSADHDKQVAETAAKADRVQGINDEIAKLQEAKAARGDTLAIEIQLRELENQRIQELVKESLYLGTARDGVRAFFLEMQEDAKKASQIIYDALNSALDRTSENMAKLLTGQKTAWAKEFKDIGEQMLQSTIKSGLQQGLGALGKKLGISLPGGAKPDGTQGNPIWVRIAGGNAGGPGGLALPGGGSLPGGVFGSGSKGGGIFSFLGGLLGGRGGSTSGTSVTSSIDFGGALAEGGGVDPGKAYMVGENGPEMFSPRASGSIVPNHALGGSTVINNVIDARNADLGAANRIHRALEATHASAVANGVRANAERSKRVPQRKR